MNKIALPLDGNYIRPTIRIGAMKILIDTGAIVSVWTQSEENLIRLFHAKDTKLFYDLKGFHDIPVKCKIYMIDLTIEKVTFYHVPIAVKKNADDVADIILTPYIFMGCRYTFDVIGKLRMFLLEIPNKENWFHREIGLKVDPFGNYRLYMQSESTDDGCTGEEVIIE